MKFTKSRLKYHIKENFFSRWSRQMAYILGFTFADGNLYKTSLAWDIQKRDIDILEKINKVLRSSYPISVRRFSVRLRVNNRRLIKGAENKGLLPRKSFRLTFPKIPKIFVRHFIRGYLDGDGWIVHRSGRNEVDLGFVCGNKKFLTDLSNRVKDRLNILGKVRVKCKITPRGIKSKTYHLEYYSLNALEVAKWLFEDLNANDLYLKRKYLKYLESRQVYKELLVKMRGKRLIQREFNKPLKVILLDLHKKKDLNGVQIANKLETSISSVYRWLEETGVKY
ncbi:MAG TPA: LAGLIDADG family homing endonuclease [Patescibacteria group bacterium]|nr:LAGLIDADG family homing endonuclease [Patescibacteria group bacterium]